MSKLSDLRECAILQMFPIGSPLTYKGIEAEVMSHSVAYLDHFTGVGIEYVTGTGKLARCKLNYRQLDKASDGSLDRLVEQLSQEAKPCQS